MARDIAVRGEAIRLGQLLKLAGVVDSGSDVKALLAGEPVWSTASARLGAGASCMAATRCASASTSCACSPPSRASHRR